MNTKKEKHFRQGGTVPNKNIVSPKIRAPTKSNRLKRNSKHRTTLVQDTQLKMMDNNKLVERKKNREN